MTNNVLFSNVIQTEDELREVIHHPSDLVLKKSVSKLDDLFRSFIEKSPFVLISSIDSKGNADISPKGDPPGFVQLLNEKTLLIPDRPGNRRADTLSNIIQNPKVGLIFLVPGKRETLRISGTAQIVLDADLREQFSIKGKIPTLLIAVTVEEAFFHCAKCIVRSHLWEKNYWPEINGLPSLAETMVKHGKLDITIKKMQEIIDNDEETRLY